MRKVMVLGAALLPSVASAVINGTNAYNPAFPEVVQLRSAHGSCSGTIVGPRVVLTAAHCATGEPTAFAYEGRVYEVSFAISRDWPTHGHDLALALTSAPIEGAAYATIGGDVEVGDALYVLGYGCTGAGGRGPHGELQLGATEVLGVGAERVVSSGGGLCYGDSGGPAFVREDGRRRLVGVNSAGDIASTNVEVRLGSATSRRFFQRAIERFGVEICGVNARCPEHAPRAR